MIHFITFMSGLTAHTDHISAWLATFQNHYSSDSWLTLHMDCLEILREQASDNQDKLLESERFCAKILNTIFRLPDNTEKKQIIISFRDYPHL